MKLLIVTLTVLAGLTASAATIANPSFETPSLGLGSFQYNPAGATWTFVGQSGIAANGSAFGYTTAPDGTQVAFLQVFNNTTSSFSETITGVNPGDVLTFFEAQRGGFGANSFNVLYNGTLLGNFTPPSTSFTSASVTIPVGAPSSGTLSFVSTGATGGDLDVALDLVRGPSAAVPEPGSIMLGVGLAGLALLGRRRRSA